MKQQKKDSSVPSIEEEGMIKHSLKLSEVTSVLYAIAATVEQLLAWPFCLGLLGKKEKGKCLKLAIWK